MKRPTTNRLWLLAAASALVLALALVGCSAAAPSSEPTESVVMVTGLMPDWNLDEMVRRSDAVVIGTLAEELGTKTYPGSAPPGESPKYNERFKDFEFTVESTFYSAKKLPDFIVVLTGPQSVPADDHKRVAEEKDIPTFAANERVLLFLDGLDDPMYNEGPGMEIPAGYVKGDYYFVIVAGNYGKLIERAGSWEDTRSHKTISVERIMESVQKVKGGPAS